MPVTTATPIALQPNSRQPRPSARSALRAFLALEHPRLRHGDEDEDHRASDPDAGREHVQHVEGDVHGTWRRLRGRQLARERIRELADHARPIERGDPELPFVPRAQEQRRTPPEPVRPDRRKTEGADVSVGHPDHGSHARRGAVEREPDRPEPERARVDWA